MASETSGIPRPAIRKKTTDPETVSKLDSDWRFLCVNINNFPTEKSGDDKAKLDLLRATLYSSDADVMGITELGRNEFKMTTHNRPSEITKKWFTKVPYIGSCVDNILHFFDRHSPLYR